MSCSKITCAIETGCWPACLASSGLRRAPRIRIPGPKCGSNTMVPGNPADPNALERTYPSHGETIEYNLSEPRALWEVATSGALRALGSMNLRASKYVPMGAEIRARLDAYYQRENEGLDELIGIDASRTWGWLS